MMNINYEDVYQQNLNKLASELRADAAILKALAASMGTQSVNAVDVTCIASKLSQDLLAKSIKVESLHLSSVKESSNKDEIPY